MYIFADYFNTTTGTFNITFNESTHAGVYHLNVTVNDSSNLTDYDDFFLFVYSPPNITFPTTGITYTLQENVTSVLNFTVNHTVQDNLTYEFYIDNVIYSSGNYTHGNLSLRYNISYYGNNTFLNWSFTPNTTDETYGQLKNLTLIVYPSNVNLTNATLINATRNFKLNVTHANSPVEFYDNIQDIAPISYANSVTVDLSDHFRDNDYSDSFYSSETITFTLYSNTSGITSSISSGWVLTLSAASVQVGEMFVVASDGSSNATSNNFTVTFVEPTGQSTEQSSSGGSSTKEVPISLKILMPDPISAYKQDRIELPLYLHNTGQDALYNIDLFGSIAKDGVLSDDIQITFSKSHFDSLFPNRKENLTMVLEVSTNEEGTFEITVNATVKTPEYSDWGKMFLTIKEGESVREKILFTEEFIIENPECLELKELVDEAILLADQGKNDEALAKADEAIAACRELIANPTKGERKPVVENPLYKYLIISTIVVFFVGISYYSYRRMVLRRKRGSFLQESIKTKNAYNNV